MRSVRLLGTICVALSLMQVNFTKQLEEPYTGTLFEGWLSDIRNRTDKKVQIRSIDSFPAMSENEKSAVQLHLLKLPQNPEESSGLYDEEAGGHCVPIEESICQGLQYTHTRLPNIVGLTTQDEAAKRMNDYRALISVGCSHYLKFFLCTIYFPMCTPALSKRTTLQPCQTLCRYVQSKCEPVMKSFSFPWPKELNCVSLPRASDMCIQPQNYDLDQGHHLIGEGLPGVSQAAIAELLPDLTEIFDKGNKNEKADANSRHSDSPGEEVRLQDRQHSEVLSDLKIQTCTSAEVSLASDKSNQNITCAFRCDANIFYQYAEKKFAQIWILCWSVLCAVSCAMTLVTFLLNRSRFIYPERPIIYISLCYLCYSLGFVLRIVLGRERASCRTHGEIAPTNPPAENWIPPLLPDDISRSLVSRSDISTPASFLIISGHEGTWCTITFLILFYFSQASYLWWTMLTLTWFLSAACKWGYEGIEAVSSILHMLAWALPALKTMIVLIMHRIDADELTGMCYVGNQDRQSLLIFVLIPQLVYLLVGFALLIIGFFSLVSVRTSLKKRTPINNPHSHPASRSLLTGRLISSRNGNIRRLDKLMAKICIFSVLYIIPTTCVICVNVYYFSNYPTWKETIHKLSKQPGCLVPKGTNWAKREECSINSLPFPSVEVKMLQTFMSLVVGITSGMWVWCNKKTLRTWTHCKSSKRSEGTMNLNVHLPAELFTKPIEDTCGQGINIAGRRTVDSLPSQTGVNQVCYGTQPNHMLAGPPLGTVMPMGPKTTDLPLNVNMNDQELTTVSSTRVRGLQNCSPPSAWHPTTPAVSLQSCVNEHYTDGSSTTFPNV